MQAFEVEQRAVGLGEGDAGDPFDDLAEQAVAGVGVGVHGARLPDGGAVVHGEAHLLQAGPTLRRVGVHGGLVGRVLTDVVDAAGVHEHVPDGDGVRSIAAGAQRVDRLRGEQIADRGVEVQPALLDEAQDRRCGERLGVAGDAEPGIGCQRCRRRPARRRRRRRSRRGRRPGASTWRTRPGMLDDVRTVSSTTACSWAVTSATPTVGVGPRSRRHRVGCRGRHQPSPTASVCSRCVAGAGRQVDHSERRYRDDRRTATGHGRPPRLVPG